jgi:hypothetical protein
VTNTFRNLKSGNLSFIFLNEDSYNGEWVEDLPHGIGTYDRVAGLEGRRWIYRDTKFVDGEPVSGSLRKMQVRDSSYHIYSYQGEFKDWIEDGKGQAEDAKSPPNRFVGVFRAGKWVEGTLTTNNSFIYTGKFDEDGKYCDPNGYLQFPPSCDFFEYRGKFVDHKFLEGVMQYRDSCDFKEYTGHFKDDQLHGAGILTWKDVNADTYKQFQGTFACGQMVEGKMTFQDGSEYEGKFLNQKMHGEAGLIRYSEDHLDYVLFAGDMVNGKFHHGLLTFACGDNFEGDFDNGNLKHGSMTFADEDKYTGDFGNERDMHGQGVINFEDIEVRGGKTRFGGDFCNDAPVQGKTSYAAGHDYVGEVNEHYEEHGQGKFTWRPSPEERKKLDCKQEFQGEFKDGLMVYGELKYYCGRTYRGKFNEDQNFHGRGIFSCIDNNTHFDGIFNNSVRQSGKLKRKTLNGITLYTGQFDDEGQEHDTEATFKFYDARTFQGNFVHGVITEGHVIYNGSGTVEPSELEYKGGLNAAALRHGQGELKWDGVNHPRGYVSCVGEFKDDKPDGQCVLVLFDGHKFEGKMVAGVPVEGKFEFADGRVYTGTLGEGELMHGHGSLFFPEDKRCFTGTFEKNFHTVGETVYANGLKLRSNFTVLATADRKIPHPCTCSDTAFRPVTRAHPFSLKYEPEQPRCARCNKDMKLIHQFGSGVGVFTFPDGTEFKHDHETKDSFHDKVTKLIEERVAAAEECNSQVETVMSELKMWPHVPDVVPVVLPSSISQPLFMAREIGGQESLLSKFETWRKLISEQKDLSERVTFLLEAEAKRNSFMTERFGDRWTLPPSAEVNALFHQKLNGGNVYLVGEDTKVEQLWKHYDDNKEKLSSLLKDDATYQNELTNREETSELRLRVLELNQAIHEVMQQRAKKLNEYKFKAKSLSIEGKLARLESLTTDQYATVVSNTLHELDDLCAQLEATAAQHRQLLAETRDAHGVLELFKNRLRAEETTAICDLISAGTDVFHHLDPKLDTSIATNSTFLESQRSTLEYPSSDLVAQREETTRRIAAGLLLNELEAAVREGKLEACEAIIAHGIPDVELKIDDPIATGETVVMLAIILGHHHLLNTLSLAGADMNRTYSDGRFSYLYLAICDPRSMQNTIGVTTRALINSGCDPNNMADTKEQMSICHIVARDDRLDVMEVLVECKIDLRREITHKEGRGRTALHWACAGDHKDTKMLQFLLRNGLIVNQVDNDSCTALHLCKSRAHAIMLVENGAQLAPKNKDNLRALDAVSNTMQATGMADDDLKDLVFRFRQYERSARQRPILNLGAVADEVTPESSFSKCQCCNLKFTALTRRHACRQCNLVSCGNCVPKRAEGSAGANTVKVRICDGCYNFAFHKSQSRIEPMH